MAKPKNIFYKSLFAAELGVWDYSQTFSSVVLGFNNSVLFRANGALGLLVRHLEVFGGLCSAKDQTQRLSHAPHML